MFDTSRFTAETPAGDRECGPCTACCTVHQVEELRKPARQACDHLCPSGCAIYESRPNTCRQFNCLWLRGGLDRNETLRPDHLGLVFDFFIWKSSNVPQLSAVEVWNGAADSPESQSLLNALREQFSVVLGLRDGRWGTLPRVESDD